MSDCLSCQTPTQGAGTRCGECGKGFFCPRCMNEHREAHSRPPPMPPTMPQTITEQLREALIAHCGTPAEWYTADGSSLERTAVACGIWPVTLYRFGMAPQGGLSLPEVNRLATYLGLELRPRAGLGETQEHSEGH